MENRIHWYDWLMIGLVVVGAINWGLVGFFSFDLVAFLFGEMSVLSRVIYALVGLSGVYLAFYPGRFTATAHREAMHHA